MGIIEKILQNAPFVSFIRYDYRMRTDNEEKKKSQNVKNLKLLGHFVYGLVVSTGLVYYPAMVLTSRE